MTQHSIEVPNQRETVLAYIEHEREAWLPWYLRAKRAGGMSAEANAVAAQHMEKLDQLLDELNGLGRLAVAETVSIDTAQ